MEIRPLGSLWEGSCKNWQMDCTAGKYRMYKGRQLLIDSRSQSWAMVSNLLKPLDASQNLLVTVCPSDSDQPSSSLQLSVALPRYRLSFYVDGDGDLQSHNIRGMVYDKDQSIGTLFGLANQLVLRPKPRENIDGDELVPRCVLIPEGPISFRMDGHHVRIEIDTRGPALRQVTYQTYRVDTDLGCLTGNGSLTSKLYCAYLHALTSGCCTDALTGRSGTEEALSLLRSGSCWSITRFSPRDAKLLSLIASMYPPRTWYPHHLRCMQKVEWLDLPVNSQHHELLAISKGIKEHYERVQIFQESKPSTLFEEFPSHDSDLLERSALRAAYLFPSEFSEQPSGADFDVRYRARDLVEIGSGEHCAYTAASVVQRRTCNPTTPKNLVNMMKAWKGIVSSDASLSLQYDRSWLAPDLPSIWIEAYKLLRRSDERKLFQLLFSLSTMAYALPELTDLVPAFVAFATDSQFRLEDPPHYDSYTPSEGISPCKDTLRSYISDCAYSFERCPESTTPAKTGESYHDLRTRQLEMYRNRRSSDTDATVQRWLNNWPCESPPRCSLNPDLYDVAGLTCKVQMYFSGCYHNLKLEEHLMRVQTILDSVYSQASPTPSLQYSFDPSQRIPSCITWSFTVHQLFARPAPLLEAHDRLPRYTADMRLSDADDSVLATLLALLLFFSLFLHSLLLLPLSLFSLFWLRSTSARLLDSDPHSRTTPLHALITTAEANAVNPFQKRYLSALRASAQCFGNEMALLPRGRTNLPTAETLLAHYDRCRTNYIKGLHHLTQHLGPRSHSEQALERSGQWPRVTPHALFRSLASNSQIILSDEWKTCLVRLALLALELQRARRLLRLHLNNLRDELRRELENEGCDGWNAETHPDWLLIQVCFPCHVYIPADVTFFAHISCKATFWFVGFKLTLPRR